MGGSETLAWRIARRLNRTGRYACAVYAVGQSGDLAGALAADGIPCRAFRRSDRFDVTIIGALARQFRASGIRLVHTHHLGQLIYGGIAARLAGARVVHTEHEFYTLARPRARRLLRLLSGLADCVTAVAPPVADFLRDRVGLPERKLRIVPNGVDVDLFRSAKPVERGSVGCEEDSLVVGCVGRLSPEKGQRVLLSAFGEVASRHPAARLLLIGDGEERARLEAQARELGIGAATRFLGMRADVPALIAACDVVVLPSHHEGLPLVLLEAMAAGKAVVATAVGAVPQILEDGRTGLVVPPGEAGALAGAMEALLRDADRRRQIGVQASAHVEASYNFDQTMAQYEAVYDAVMGARREAHGMRR